MKVNLVDLLVVCYLAYGIWRGGRRGLSEELPSLVSLGLIFVIGTGLFQLTELVLTALSAKTGLVSGPLGFLAVIIGALAVVRHFRRQLQDWGKRRVPDPAGQRRWGRVAGGVRTIAVCALVVLSSNLIPIGEFRKPLTRGSMFGRVVKRAVEPIHRIFHPPADHQRSTGPAGTGTAPAGPVGASSNGGGRYGSRN
jgi:hypothetical protein